MIQRIQSLYLLLSSLCLGLMNYFNISIFENEYVLNLKGLFKDETSFLLGSWEDLPLEWIGAALITINFIIIFLFKNRKLQALLGRLQYLLILAYVVLIYFTIDKIGIALPVDQPQISYGVGVYLPVAALVFNFLANRSIKKDDALIKSLDRLR